MMKRILGWFYLVLTVLFFLGACSKDTGTLSGGTGNSGGSGNTGGSGGSGGSGSGSGGNPTAPPLSVGIRPGSIEAGLPASAFELEARPYYTSTPATPVINQVEWKRLTGPAASQIQSPASLNTSVSQLVYGTYVFQCRVRDQAGMSDSATAVISMHDPLRTEQEVVLTNQNWVQTGMGQYFRINLFQQIPAGAALKKVFIKTDCASAFSPLPNFWTAPGSSYTYWLEYFNNTVWLHVGNYATGPDVCSQPQDTPDIRLIY